MASFTKVKTEQTKLKKAEPAGATPLVGSAFLTTPRLLSNPNPPQLIPDNQALKQQIPVDNTPNISYSNPKEKR
jgi:hypothetical protein